MTVEEIVNSVNVALTTKNEDGSTKYDVAALKEVLAALNAKKKELTEAVKTAAKENAAANEKRAIAYIKTLAEGSAISYSMADGTIRHGVIKAGKGTKTVHVVLNAGEYDPAKKPDRYVKFAKICVPDDFVEVEEATA